jgi:hypothetical protein
MSLRSVLRGGTVIIKDDRGTIAVEMDNGGE